jgi:hypothetical protein
MRESKEPIEQGFESMAKLLKTETGLGTCYHGRKPNKAGPTGIEIENSTLTCSCTQTFASLRLVNSSR